MVEPPAGGTGGSNRATTVALELRWRALSRPGMQARLVAQLGWWTDICRSVQLVLQAAKVWIWALTILGLAGP